GWWPVGRRKADPPVQVQPVAVRELAQPAEVDLLQQCRTGGVEPAVLDRDRRRHRGLVVAHPGNQVQQPQRAPGRGGAGAVERERRAGQAHRLDQLGAVVEGIDQPRHPAGGIESAAQEAEGADRVAIELPLAHSMMSSTGSERRLYVLAMTWPLAPVSATSIASPGAVAAGSFTRRPNTSLDSQIGPTTSKSRSCPSPIRSRFTMSCQASYSAGRISAFMPASRPPRCTPSFSTTWLQRASSTPASATRKRPGSIASSKPGCTFLTSARPAPQSSRSNGSSSAAYGTGRPPPMSSTSTVPMRRAKPAIASTISRQCSRVSTPLPRCACRPVMRTSRARASASNSSTRDAARPNFEALPPVVTFSWWPSPKPRSMRSHTPRPRNTSGQRCSSSQLSTVTVTPRSNAPAYSSTGAKLGVNSTRAGSSPGTLANTCPTSASDTHSSPNP